MSDVKERAEREGKRVCEGFFEIATEILSLSHQQTECNHEIFLFVESFGVVVISICWTNECIIIK